MKNDIQKKWGKLANDDLDVIMGDTKKQQANFRRNMDRIEKKLKKRLMTINSNLVL